MREVSPGGRSGAPRPPSGSRWNTFRQLVFRTYGDICVGCDHGGARHVDHVIPLTERPDLAWALSNCRPIHGISPGNRNPCPVCGVNCNAVKGGFSLERARRLIAERAAANRKAQPKPSRPPDAGRPW